MSVMSLVSSGPLLLAIPVAAAGWVAPGSTVLCAPVAATLCSPPWVARSGARWELAVMGTILPGWRPVGILRWVSPNEVGHIDCRGSGIPSLCGIRD